MEYNETVTDVFEIIREKYIRVKGTVAYTKLVQKINHSKAFNELLGISVRRSMPPTVSDFNYVANTMSEMWFCFDNAKLTMAAIIMLYIWNEQVNQIYELMPEFTVVSMMKQLAAKSIYLHC